MTYKADINPNEAAALLAKDANAVLIDVRTMAEWNWVGVPDIDGARFVQWVSWPDGQANGEFVAEASAGLESGTPIVTMCRSGGRSAAAATALTAAGFSDVYNMAGGFEGDPDAAGHRTGGWRGADLPWKQS